MRKSLLWLGLLGFSVNAFASWETKVVLDPGAESHFYNLRASNEFPIFSLSCISFDDVPVDMLHINRLTAQETGSIKQIEIRIDNNPAMIFFPSQHKIDVGFNYHNHISTGIETVTLMPATESGKLQYTELVRQFIAGNQGTARLVTSDNEVDIDVSLIGFTKAYRPMRNACVKKSASIAESNF